MTGQQVQRPRAAQLLAVLALLLGLLGMHGLVSGHHAPSAVRSAAVASLQPSTGQEHPSVLLSGHQGHASVGHEPVATATSAPGLSSLAAVCADCAEHGAALLCLAVLSAGLALLARLLACRAHTQALPVPALRLRLLRAGPPLRLRPPDLVAQLCVSRT